MSVLVALLLVLFGSVSLVGLLKDKDDGSCDIAEVIVKLDGDKGRIRRKGIVHKAVTSDGSIVDEGELVCIVGESEDGVKIVEVKQTGILG